MQVSLQYKFSLIFLLKLRNLRYRLKIQTNFWEKILMTSFLTILHLQSWNKKYTCIQRGTRLCLRQVTRVPENQARALLQNLNSQTSYTLFFHLIKSPFPGRKCPNFKGDFGIILPQPCFKPSVNYRSDTWTLQMFREFKIFSTEYWIVELRFLAYKVQQNFTSIQQFNQAILCWFFTICFQKS